MGRVGGSQKANRILLATVVLSALAVASCLSNELKQSLNPSRKSHALPIK
ncbi:hypothetical protein SAMN04487935_0829 [Flavobacterium noncentrifugens]|uniref:Uncharacterized protein n=1 Tax=Flavobacterium noncentrifugens TaxID=1128970 RepID=A0A1G8T4U3_9FLAO|nr:hypothetical protein SAMN04487935_0829 [Flavobacterium noncentrifugens]